MLKLDWLKYYQTDCGLLATQQSETWPNIFLRCCLLNRKAKPLSIYVVCHQEMHNECEEHCGAWEIAFLVSAIFGHVGQNYAT